MPVHLDSHNSDVDLTPGTTKSDIVAFLYNVPELGYKPAEISDELDVPSGTATATLSRLHSEGYVGKTDDGYYHALEHRRDLQRYTASLDQLERMFSQKAPSPGGTEPADVDDDELEDELADLEDELESDAGDDLEADLEADRDE